MILWPVPLQPFDAQYDVFNDLFWFFSDNVVILQHVILFLFGTNEYQAVHYSRYGFMRATDFMQEERGDAWTDRNLHHGLFTKGLSQDDQWEHDHGQYRFQGWWP